FRDGLTAFLSYYAEFLSPLQSATDAVEKLQAAYGHPALVVPVLAALATATKQYTRAERVRAHVMLPTWRSTRVVTYQWGMDKMPDNALELASDGGCSGFAYSKKRPCFADLTKAKSEPANWKMTQAQQDRVPDDLAAMISVPLLDTTDITPSTLSIKLE